MLYVATRNRSEGPAPSRPWKTTKKTTANTGLEVRHELMLPYFGFETSWGMLGFLNPPENLDTLSSVVV